MSRGRCPTTDFRKSACDRKRHRRIFDFKVIRWSAFDVCPRGSVHLEGRQRTQQLVKQIPLRKSQLCCVRFTLSLLLPTPDHSVKGTTALASLRHNAGVWTSCRVSCDGPRGRLSVSSELDHRPRRMGECSRLLGVICALLDNSILFVESCVSYPVMDRLPLLTHPLLAAPLLPPVLSILHCSSLPPTHSTHLRASTAQPMLYLLTQRSTTHPSWAPRMVTILPLVLVSTGKSRGTREGATQDLVGVDKAWFKRGSPRDTRWGGCRPGELDQDTAR